MLSNDSSAHAPPSSGTYAYNTFSPGSSGFPAVGAAYTDPVFGATNTEGSIVRRFTNIGATTSLSSIYAHHWANADGSYMFDDIGGNGSLKIRDTSNASVVWSAQPQGDQYQELQWHPTDPVLYYIVSGAALVERNLSAQTSTTIHTFPSTLQNQGNSHDWLDKTGNYFCVSYTDGGSVKAHVWDRSNNTVFAGAFTAAGPGAGGYTCISPDGAYLIDVGSLNKAYPINTSTKTIGTGTEYMTSAFPSGDHQDFVSASNGHSYAVVFNSNSSEVWRMDLSLDQNGKTEAQQKSANQLLTTYDGSNDALHFNAVGRGTFQDWVCIEENSVDDGFNSSTSPWRAYKSELRCVNVTTLEQRRLIHHRSRYAATANAYFTVPHPSFSWDGSFLLFQSDFNNNAADGYSDLYGISDPFGTGSSFQVCWARNNNQ